MLKTVAAQAGATGTLTYVGTWDASANSPTLTSGVGTLNNYYVVSVAGNTTLDGVSNWNVGDWAIFNGTVWQKVDGSNLGTMAYQNASSVTITGGSFGNGVFSNANITSVQATFPNSFLTNNAVTIGNTSVSLGGTASSVNGLTLTNVSISSGNVTITNANVTTANVTNFSSGNVTITGGTENNVTYTNVSISSGNATLTKVTASTVVATANTAPSSNIGAIQVGANSFNDTGVLANFQSNIAGYNQVTVQNTSTANNASAEFIAYNNLGTAATNFATVGINSSTYAGTGSVNAPGYGYFLSGSTDMVVGTIGNNAIHFVANSSAADAMVVNSNNTVTMNSLAQSTSSSATFATSSLPLVPAGYIIVNNNGTNVKIPYYAV